MLRTIALCAALGVLLPLAGCLLSDADASLSAKPATMPQVATAAEATADTQPVIDALAAWPAAGPR